VAQLIPHYRSRPIIQAGTAFLLLTPFIQTVDLVLFLQYFKFFVAVLAALVSLGSLLASQKRSHGAQSLLSIAYYAFSSFTYIPVDGAHDGRSSQSARGSSTPVSASNWRRIVSSWHYASRRRLVPPGQSVLARLCHSNRYSVVIRKCSFIIARLRRDDGTSCSARRWQCETNI
jgi:hypothetical protein